MMKHTKQHIFTLLIFITLTFLLNCGGTSSAAVTDDTTIGTISGNPTIPQNNVVPDFDTQIPDTALDGAGKPDSSMSLMKTIKYLTGPAALWDDIFVVGGMESARNHRANLEILGTEIRTQLEARGIEEVTDEFQSFDLDPIEFLDGPTSFSVDLVLDNDPEFVRMYIRSQETDEYVGTYVFTTNDEGDPFRGIIVMLDPDTFTDEHTESKRYVGVAYDFSNEEQHLMTMRVEEYNEAVGFYVAYHVHYECNLVTKECIGEYVDIQSDPPERTLTYHMRFTWNEETKNICLAEVSYESGETVMSDTQEFVGPNEPDDEDVTTNLCEIPDPYWVDHVYVADDLPFRYEDETDAGETGVGTAFDMFQDDGASYEGFDILTPERIETWLLADEF